MRKRGVIQVRFDEIKRKMLSIKWKRILPRLVSGVFLCWVAMECLSDGHGPAMLLGIILLLFGLWLLYGIYKDMRLDKEGETVYAKITDISHGSVSVNDEYIYTVTCRTGDRCFTKKTTVPLDASYIGNTVAVRVSPRSPDIYDIDFENIYLTDSEAMNTSDPAESDASAPAVSEVPAVFAPPSGYSRQLGEGKQAGNVDAPEPPDMAESEQESVAKTYTPLDWSQTREFIRFPAGALIAFVLFLIIGISFSCFVGNRKAAHIIFLFFFTPGFICVLISVLNLLKRRNLYRDGRQVRAKICSAKLSYTYNGDPVYKVSCIAGDECFSGSLRLHLKDPDLTGKWVTVFVSRANPKRYTIEGKTLSKDY